MRERIVLRESGDAKRSNRNCKDISSEEISKLTFTTGYSAEHILKVLKWLFIEQDIRYWNYSGRAKTRGIIPTKD